MKYSNLNNGSSGGSGNFCFRCFKNITLKAFIISLFAFSTVFILYQLIYYMLLNEYQIEESHHRKFDLFSEGGKSTQQNQIPDFQDNLVVAVEEDGHHHQQKDKGDLGPHPPHVERKKGKPVLSSKILGVKPTDLHLYTDQQNRRDVFQCLTTSKKISWDKVNDDYCDCPLDGSDEPSTAACLNGKFYCVRRKDGIKGYIPSSRVNDGICDCQDGTDEHAGLVRCKKWLLN
ncbi:unnamed protein product [Orchesella dallaii]|uniref:Glucosidase II beta subunit N-terminal domain-containing protein n=1 Tax=Orchesella dallaii TaxID=48710 RepID=A0ABP1PQE4_9HEXA